MAKRAARRAARKPPKRSKSGQARTGSKPTHRPGRKSAATARRPKRPIKGRKTSSARGKKRSARAGNPKVISRRSSRVTRNAKAKAKAKFKLKPRPKPRPAVTRTRTAATVLKRPAATPKPPRRVALGLARDRRLLPEEERVPTPPSSLDMDRRGSAVRTGRAEMAEERENLGSMQELTGGDIDADAENAYFSGEEAPGGDNPTPDQDIVDDIGRSLGVEYQDAEELRGSDKVADRDKHRWELDPASSEDYKNR